jgi:L-lysine exporter family protein LysE/ArgO
MTVLFVSGLLLGLAVITPIGPQNVFVIGQGLTAGMPRALWAVLIAGLCDNLMILAGVAGVSGAISALPTLRLVLILTGVAFLGYLGTQALRSTGGSLDGLGGGPAGMRQLLSRTATVSLLNPHAFLDTVGVIGSAVSTRAPGDRVAFTAGALSASWLWFLLLAGGAAFLRRRLTARSTVWLDRLSGGVMIVFAVLFLVEFVRGVGH